MSNSSAVNGLGALFLIWGGRRRNARCENLGLVDYCVRDLIDERRALTNEAVRGLH